MAVSLSAVCSLSGLPLPLQCIDVSKGEREGDGPPRRLTEHSPG